MRIERVGRGFVVNADSTDPLTRDWVVSTCGLVPLIVADPPYGNVVRDQWDRWTKGCQAFVDQMLSWTRLWGSVLLPDAAFYVWGGIGSPGFRPFFQYLARVEDATDMKIANLITWKKRRGYGIQHNYLFTREELVYLINGPDIKRPRLFNVPLLDERRGYAGFNKEYPAKSEFYRRSNVWTDVTEIMRGKVHEAEKPVRLAEIMIESHTIVDEWVVDPFAGSGTTALAAIRLNRPFVVIEKDTSIYESMLERLRVNWSGRGVGSEHGSEQETQSEPDT